MDYRTAIAGIVKMLSPHVSTGARNAFSTLLAEAGNGKIHENLSFRYMHIGILFHPNDRDAASALAKQAEAARESGELQSIISLDRGLVMATDLLTWPDCPPVTAGNPLSFWLPVTSDTHSGTPGSAAPPATVATPADETADTDGLVSWQASTLESWGEIKNKHGPKPSARKVMAWLKTNGPRDVFGCTQPNTRESLAWLDRAGNTQTLTLRRLGNVISEWRKAGKISR